MTNLPLYSFLALPSDILILILHELVVVHDLASLSRTCRFFHALVNEFGWAGYQRCNPRPSLTLSKSRKTWSHMVRVKYDVLTDTAWSQSEFIARPLSGSWAGKEQPLLAISPSRLVIAAGSNLDSYIFGVSTNGDAPPIKLEGSCSLSINHSGREYSRCITALTFIPDGGLDVTLCVGFQDGAFERIVLAGSSKRQGSATLRVHRSSGQLPQLRTKDLLESLSSSSNLLLSLSSGGVATLMDIGVPSPSPSTIDLQARSWASHLCIRSSSPYAAFGTSSATPLTIHSITNDRLSQTPSAILRQEDSINNGSAVYDICEGPPSSPWGSSPQVVVSGWYSGAVSIHDLRSSSRSSAPHPSALRPVLTLVDPWSNEPIYSVSCGGGAGSHVAAGSARHSLVSFWDVRSPLAGFSLHAPFNDPSPVYAVLLESSRLFGVTQSRPFVLDFGPGTTKATYPHLGHSSKGFTHLDQRGSDGLGYYVTKYWHRSSSI